MAVYNAQQTGNAQQENSDYVTDQDAQARKRTAIGLSPHRATAPNAVQRPPDATSRFPQWLLLTCLVLMAAALGLMLTARAMNPEALWPWQVAQPTTTTEQIATSTMPEYAAPMPGYTLWMTDDFSQANSNVQQYDVPGQMTATILPEKGIYRLEVAPGQIGWTLFDLDELSNVQFETSAVVDPTTPLGAAAIIGRFVTPGNFYLFRVDGTGAVTIELWKDGQAFTVLPSATFPVVNRAGEANRLTLVDEGNQLRFFVNQALIHSVADPQLDGNRTGVAALSSGNDFASVDFDWVTIYDN